MKTQQKLIEECYLHSRHSLSSYLNNRSSTDDFRIIPSLFSKQIFIQHLRDYFHLGCSRKMIWFTKFMDRTMKKDWTIDKTGGEQYQRAELSKVTGEEKRPGRGWRRRRVSGNELVTNSLSQICQIGLLNIHKYKCKIY